MTAATQGRRRAWYRRLIPIPAVPASRPRPAADAGAALALLADLEEEEAGVPDATRSRMLAPDSPAAATIVIWHGFTNSPSQFVPVAEALAARGYRVLLPRMPRHGHADLLNRDLEHLTTAELVEHADRWLDVAAGFGDPVWTVGLSAGGTLGAWAAATRQDVSRLVLVAPLVAPVGFPMALVRLLVRFPRAVRMYWWWDPRLKADLGHSPYAYPGFPVPGLMPFLNLSEALLDRAVVPGHPLERVVLVSNPGDFAIRLDVARSFTLDVFAGAARTLEEAFVDEGLKWWHDFVDPWSPNGGTPEQVAAVLLAALGVGEPTAGGVLVEQSLRGQPRQHNPNRSRRTPARGRSRRSPAQPPSP